PLHHQRRLESAGRGEFSPGLRRSFLSFDLRIRTEWIRLCRCGVRLRTLARRQAEARKAQGLALLDLNRRSRIRLRLRRLGRLGQRGRTKLQLGLPRRVCVCGLRCNRLRRLAFRGTALEATQIRGCYLGPPYDPAKCRTALQWRRRRWRLVFSGRWWRARWW